mmetsp:Transcript_107221/g.212842  ORF Transcript_107221/g.212842 Transcript_107221/m.212842 type:complete len:90 (+) Transcript_107221:2174-2443(+)
MQEVVGPCELQPTQHGGLGVAPEILHCLAWELTVASCDCCQKHKASRRLARADYRGMIAHSVYAETVLDEACFISQMATFVWQVLPWAS